MLHIRQAIPEDLSAIMELYDGIIDRFHTQPGKTGWVKGVYPAQADFQSALRDRTMYLGEVDGRLAAGMVLRRGMDDAYQSAPWQVDAADSEVAVIHLLGVSPSFAGQNLGCRMIEQALSLARGWGQRAVRLDVLDSNTPAQRMYERAGFQYISKIKIFYTVTGLSDFLLYEYLL